jgi:hypothetical protein
MGNGYTSSRNVIASSGFHSSSQLMVSMFCIYGDEKDGNPVEQGFKNGGEDLSLRSP